MDWIAQIEDKNVDYHRQVLYVPKELIENQCGEVLTYN
jgi:hypothetical protein